MELDSVPLDYHPPPADYQFTSPMVTSLPHSIWPFDNSNITPVSMDTPSAEFALVEPEDVHMAEVGGADSQTIAPPIVGDDPGVPLSVLQPLPPTVSHAPASVPAVHETAASLPARPTTQISLHTPVSAPVALADAPSPSYTQEVMQHYAHLFQKERTRINQEETKSINDELLALFELPPGSLNAAAEARASSVARNPYQSHAFRAQQRFGLSSKDQARFPSVPSIQHVVTSQDFTHNLHGIRGAFQGHDVRIAPSICVSAKGHDSSRGIASEFQPFGPPTIIPSSQSSAIKVPPSSPVTKPPRLLHALPTRSRVVKARPTTSSPSSSPGVANQKTNTGGGRTQNVGKNSALHEPLQQVEVALPLAPTSNAIAQSSGSQRTPNSNVGSSSCPPPPLVARSPVAPRFSVAAPSTSAPSSSSTTAVILQPCPRNRPVPLHSFNQQPGSSSVAQGTGSAVTVAEGGALRPHRPRPKWMEDAEMQEEKEDAKSEEWKRSHFGWNLPPRRDGHRGR